MSQIDERFLSVHARTALWWEQRERCNACANVRNIGQDAGMRCAVVELPGPINPRLQQGAFCIDAREAGAACGPDAKLFAPVVGAAPGCGENSTVGRADPNQKGT